MNKYASNAYNLLMTRRDVVITVTRRPL